MIALLLAAALAGVHPGQPSDPGGLLTPPLAQPEPPVACARLETQTVAPNGVPFRKLNELPRAAVEHAVWRTVEGCPVREVVWQGQTYYLASVNPTLDSGPLRGSSVRKYSSQH
jgi:hypothetical protein